MRISDWSSDVCSSDLRSSDNREETIMSSAADAGQGMLCPVCKVTLSISERQGVEIDFCPQCRGVWLDRGELDKIIERSETAMPPPPRDDSREGSQPWGTQDDSHRAGTHGYNRRRRFHSDLFD